MSFAFQPQITGQYLSVRPLGRTDYEPLYAAAADPLIWAQHPEPLRWQRPVFDRLFARLLSSGGALVAIDTTSHAVIGSSSFYDYRPDSADIVIGYTFLARPYWGGRCNAELKLMMLEHAFQYIETVWFHVGKGNLRSQRAMSKVGATLSHEMLRESGGVTASFIHYAIHRASFPAICQHLRSSILADSNPQASNL